MNDISLRDATRVAQQAVATLDEHLAIWGGINERDAWEKVRARVVVSDEAIDDLLWALNNEATHIDAYQWGLPLSDEDDISRLRQRVYAWLDAVKAVQP